MKKVLQVLRTRFFLATVAKSQPVTPEQARLCGWKRLLAELMKVFSPLL